MLQAFGVGSLRVVLQTGERVVPHDAVIRQRTLQDLVALPGLMVLAGFAFDVGEVERGAQVGGVQDGRLLETGFRLLQQALVQKVSTMPEQRVNVFNCAVVIWKNAHGSAK